MVEVMNGFGSRPPSSVKESLALYRAQNCPNWMATLPPLAHGPPLIGLPPRVTLPPLPFGEVSSRNP